VLTTVALLLRVGSNTDLWLDEIVTLVQNMSPLETMATFKWPINNHPFNNSVLVVSVFACLANLLKPCATRAALCKRGLLSLFFFAWPGWLPSAVRPFW
jgi:hypothetical protein